MDEKILSDIGTQVKGLATDLAPLVLMPEELKAAKVELGNLKENLTKSDAQVTALAKDLAEYRALAKSHFGRSGAMDYDIEFGNFIKAVWHTQVGAKRGLAMPKWLTKSAEDYVITDNAQGGYLVPTLLGDFVNKLTERHGFIWPYVNKVTVPDGVAVTYPWELTLATVTWRAGQGGAMTEEAAPIGWGSDTLRTDMVHDYVKIGNEAMKAPGISIPQNLAQIMTKRIIRKIEEGIVLGDADGSPYAPHDGIYQAASVNSQAEMATVTMALMTTFIGECLADHEGSGDTSENFIIINDAVAHVLKSAASALGLNAWGDPTTGVPPTFHGYRLLTTPHAYASAHWLAFMAPLSKVTVGWSGGFGVDFNDSLGWVSNETYMKVSTHADFVLGNPDMYHKALISALA